MSKSNFITIEYFYLENTDIPDNVEATLVNASIQKSQDFQIRDFLGAELFNKIDLEIFNETISGNYLVLLRDYICPPVAKWSGYNLMVKLAFRFTNKGINQKYSEWSDKADLNGLNFARGIFEKEAIALQRRAKEYLDANKNLFPEWDPECARREDPGTKRWGFSNDKWDGFLPPQNQHFK
jgi:hypothetical protein